MIPRWWCMESLALDRWLHQASDRMRLGSSIFLDWDPGQSRPYELLDGGIAVIPVQGPLSKGDRWWSMGSSYSAIGNMVRRALSDVSVRSLLLDIDSPGGEASGCQELGAVLAAADAKKPVYAWADGQCCSAAYWLASTARVLAATPTTTVGSIGVIGVHLEISQAAEKAGYTYTVFSAGKEKAYGNQYEKLSPQARSAIQAEFDGLYALFVGDVAANRSLENATSGQWADGQCFLAQAGQDAGLVDRIQHRDEFLASIREEHMDRQELKAQHPDLYQAVLAEGKEAAAAETGQALSQAKTEAAQAAQQQVVVMAGVLGGAGLQTKLEAALAAGLTGEALAQAAKIMGPAGPAQGLDTDKGSSAMLAALQSLDAGGVAPDKGKPSGAASNANALVDYVKQRYGGAK